MEKLKVQTFGDPDLNTAVQKKLFSMEAEPEVMTLAQVCKELGRDVVIKKE